MLPHGVREAGGVVTVIIALLFAANVRAAFLKPLFLIMIMVRFHALVENQPINQVWGRAFGTALGQVPQPGTGRGARGGFRAVALCAAAHRPLRIHASFGSPTRS